MAYHGLAQYEDVRVPRKATATFYHGEDGTTHVRQPQSLCFADGTTGREVWELYATPNSFAEYQNDIAFSLWSANGRRLFFEANLITPWFTKGSDLVNFLISTNGANCRPIGDGTCRLGGINSHQYAIHWDPARPNIYYAFGEQTAGQTDVSANILYRCTVSDTGITREAWLTFPSGSYLLRKSISPCGNYIMAWTWTSDSTLFPAQINGATPALLVAGGYSCDRGMTAYSPTPESYSSLHDLYLLRYPYYTFMPDTVPGGRDAQWRAEIVGSAGDGGALYTYSETPPYWDEVFPVGMADDSIPHGEYTYTMTHPGWDRWGEYVVYGRKEETAHGTPMVFRIADRTHITPPATGYIGCNGYGHGDWSAFSDWFAWSRGSDGDPNYNNDAIYTARRDNNTSLTLLTAIHSRLTAARILAYPFQSPDGTKVAFHSDQFNPTADRGGLFWVVAYYPHPPTITGATKSGIYVRLAWDWDTDSRYTNRKWPDEVTGSYLDPKETRRYHVWVSTDHVTWTEATTTGVSVGTETYDYAQPISTTRYYAVTQEEWSGLESRCLSNIWQVTLDGTGAITTSAEHIAYPANPKAASAFYTTAPSAPDDLAVTTAYGGIAGHNRLTWTEPPNSKIRYYNVYYSTSATPAATPANRIASLPVGTNEWVDWLADPAAGNHYYLVSSVDRQGNEGATVTAGEATLQAGNRYYWRVRVTDAAARVSAWSGVQRFDIALVGTGAFSWGKFSITGGTGMTATPVEGVGAFDWGKFSMSGAGSLGVAALSGTGDFSWGSWFMSGGGPSAGFVPAGATQQYLAWKNFRSHRSRR